MKTRVGHAAWAVTAALAIAACGGGRDDAEPAVDDETPSTNAEAAEPSDEPVGEPESATSEDSAAESEPEASEPAGEESTGTFEPGSINYRAVNLLDDPVDLYVRTSGLVEAFLIQEGLAPGEVSDFVAPPESGIFLVAEAGATDPTCVGSCDQFIAELGTFPDEGPTRTVILWGDEFDPTQALDLWEEPTPETRDASNRMVDPDPTVALAVITGIAVKNADFGLRISAEGVDGCLESNQPGILVGGTQTPAYAFDRPGAVITVHDQPDQECSEPPVGGPFTIDGGPGSRTHVILSGEPGSLSAVILPMEGDAPVGETSSAADGELALDLMTDEVVANFGLESDQASCAAGLLVDRIGADVLVVDGALVDLDTLPQDVNDIAGAALFDSVDECGIDPAAFGG